jgi:geranylgeranyl pyrophosphate synthase
VSAVAPTAARPSTGALLGMAPHRAVADFAGEERLAADLADCVGRIQEIVEGEPLIVASAVREMAAGGKRLRPLLVLATAYAGGTRPCTPAADRAVRAAVVVELLHLASLVHDDIMDEADTRHGVSSVNARVGTIQAILAGDYLLARGLADGSGLGRDEGVLAARTFTRLCEGQAQESAALFDPARTEEAYLAAIYGKTAALFQAACGLGAMAAGLSADTARAMEEYGRQLGMAFQLVDDLLDLTGDSATLGKPAGHDIVVGVYTLPLLRAMGRRPELRRVLANSDRETAAREAVAVVRDCGALDDVRHAVTRHCERAVEALSGAGGELGTAGVRFLTGLATTLTRRSR